MKTKITYACGHVREVQSVMPLTFTERKRISSWHCPECAAKSRTRKPRRVKDDDLASDIFGKS